jgi:phage FluMu protein Com
MATLTMRAVRPGEVPKDGGTAVQDDPERPVFRGNGPNDYVCVSCGNLLAQAMDDEYMTFRVRIRCGRCRTINVSATDEYDPSKRGGSGGRERA